MDSFSAWLDGMLKENHLSQTEIAKQLGVSQSLVSKVLSGNKRPSAEFCLKVASVFNLPSSYVLELAGLAKDEDKTIEDSPTVKEITLLAKTLPEDKRKQVLDFIRFLRKK